MEREIVERGRGARSIDGIPPPLYLSLASILYATHTSIYLSLSSNCLYSYDTKWTDRNTMWEWKGFSLDHWERKGWARVRKVFPLKVRRRSFRWKCVMWLSRLYHFKISIFYQIGCEEALNLSEVENERRFSYEGLGTSRGDYQSVNIVAFVVRIVTADFDRKLSFQGNNKKKISRLIRWLIMYFFKL
jgi:hypothetical protein